MKDNDAFTPGVIVGVLIMCMICAFILGWQTSYWRGIAIEHGIGQYNSRTAVFELNEPTQKKE